MCVLVLGLMLVLPVMALEDDQTSNIEMEYTKVDVRIHNSYAITEVTQGFVNNGDIAAEHTFSYSISERALVSNLTLTIGEDVMYSIVVPKDIAAAAYDYQVSIGVTASHMTYRGNSVYTHSFNLEAGETAEVVFRYEEIIPRKTGFYNYSQIIDPETFQGTFEFEAMIHYTEEISNVTISGFQEPVIETESISKVLVKASDAPEFLGKMIIINYEVANPSDEGNMVFFEDDNTGYFMHIFSPELDDVGGNTMPKQITFCIDKSGSMTGDKIAQVKEAFSAILPALDTRDSFGIVLFDSVTSEPLGSDLIPADTTEKTDAISTVNGVGAGGGTNIKNAMVDGLDQLVSAESDNPILVLLTDGQGSTDPDILRQEIINSNSIGAQIYCLGFGDDVDFDLLEAISLENDGEALKIYLGTDAADQITDFYDMISVTMLGNISFEYSPDASMWYPKETKSLFQGSEIVVSGIYPKGNSEVIADISAMSDLGAMTYSRTFHSDPDPDNDYVARFWAYARINHLLDKISVEGETNETVNEIISIAVSYNFVTPYTSFISGDQLEDALEAAGLDLATYELYKTSYIPVDGTIYDWGTTAQPIDTDADANTDPSQTLPDTNSTTSSAIDPSTPVSGTYPSNGGVDIDDDGVGNSTSDDYNVENSEDLGLSMPFPGVLLIVTTFIVGAVMFAKFRGLKDKKRRGKEHK